MSGCEHPTSWPHSAEGVGCLHDHPAAVSGDDELREAIAQWLIDHDSSRGTTGSWNAWHEDADAVLALPGVAALRAKAAAADRVRALCEQLPVWNTWRQRIEIALDGGVE